MQIDVGNLAPGTYTVTFTVEPQITEMHISASKPAPEEWRATDYPQAHTDPWAYDASHVTEDLVKTYLDDPILLMHMDRGEKIQGIKHIRNSYRNDYNVTAGLKECKNAYEAIQREYVERLAKADPWGNDSNDYIEPPF